MILSSNLTNGYSAHPATMADLPGVVQLINACATVETGAATTPDAKREDWLNADLPLATHTWIVRAPGGAPAAYIELWHREAYAQFYAWSRVHPDHATPAIGHYLAGWLNTRLADQTSAHNRTLLLNSGADAVTGDAVREVLKGYGYRLTASMIYMGILLDAPPDHPEQPAGITLRTYAPGDDRRAVQDMLQEAFAGVRHDVPGAVRQWMRQALRHTDFDPALWFLATTVTGSTETITGAALCSIRCRDGQNQGWISELGVHPAWRRRGIGQALLREAFGAFYARGINTIGLQVDANNPTGAHQLYARAGMVVTRRFYTFERESRA
ncbi:MAG: GNAT family N-acetyltransferase [Anaerolineae bacterium]|nr:GNAT family N-acetyltransferase [Anaerolineae bacterium]